MTRPSTESNYGFLMNLVDELLCYTSGWLYSSKKPQQGSSMRSTCRGVRGLVKSLSQFHLSSRYTVHCYSHTITNHCFSACQKTHPPCEQPSCVPLLPRVWQLLCWSKSQLRHWILWSEHVIKDKECCNSCLTLFADHWYAGCTWDGSW